MCVCASLPACLPVCLCLALSVSVCVCACRGSTVAGCCADAELPLDSPSYVNAGAAESASAAVPKSSSCTRFKPLLSKRA